MLHRFANIEGSCVASSRILRRPLYRIAAMTWAGVLRPWITCVTAPRLFKKSFALIGIVDSAGVGIGDGVGDGAPGKLPLMGVSRRATGVADIATLPRRTEGIAPI